MPLGAQIIDGEAYKPLRTDDPAMGGSDSRIYLSKKSVAKVYSTETFTTELEAYKKWGHLPSLPSLLYTDGKKTLVIEKASGIPLMEILRKHPEQANLAIIATAKALGELHQATEITTKLRSTRSNVRSLIKFSEEHRIPLNNFLVKQTPMKTGLTHSDLHPGNIFIDGNKVTFIDLETLQEAPLALDIAFLFIQLERLDLAHLQPLFLKHYPISLTKAELDHARFQLLSEIAIAKYDRDEESALWALKNL